MTIKLPFDFSYQMKKPNMFLIHVFGFYLCWTAYIGKKQKCTCRVRKCLSVAVFPYLKLLCNLPTYLVQLYNIKFWGLSWTPLPTLISDVINGHFLTKKTCGQHSFNCLNIYYNDLGHPNVALKSWLTTGIYRSWILMNT